jgi:hypothetical protein
VEWGRRGRFGRLGLVRSDIRTPDRQLDREHGTLAWLTGNLDRPTMVRDALAGDASTRVWGELGEPGLIAALVKPTYWAAQAGVG